MLIWYYPKDNIISDHINSFMVLRYQQQQISNYCNFSNLTNTSADTKLIADTYKHKREMIEFKKSKKPIEVLDE